MENINPDFLIGLIFGISLGMIFMNLFMKYQGYKRKKWFASVDTKNPENQLKFLETGHIRKTSVMGFEAYQRFKFIEEFLLRRDFKGYRVFAETCLGGFLAHQKHQNQIYSKDQIEAGFRCKRLDFLIINPKGFPALAIEYHGTGHFKGDWEARDKVKALSLQKAEIPLLVLYKDTGKEDILKALDFELKKQQNRF